MLTLRRLTQIFAIAVVVALAGAPAAPSVSAQGHRAEYGEFYEALEPFGRWFEHPRWGLVWWPYVQQDEEWRPYTRGQWLYTDDHGWYWDSDEEWGWATYHYGRWVLEERYGWLWVPGNEWAPAWVAWRESDEYIGWAPLAPDAIWEPDYGVRYSYAEYDTPRWAPIWCFVYPRYLLAPRVWQHFAHRSRNAYLLGRTRHATRYSIVGGRIHNRGVDVRHIARITGRSIPALQVRSFNSPRDLVRRRNDGEFVGIYRPQFNSAKQGPRFTPRLTTPDAIESARRTRTTLRDFGAGDQPGRDRTLRSVPNFNGDAARSRNPPHEGPPSIVGPGKGPSPDDNRRWRERPVGPPSAALNPLPQPPAYSDTSRSPRYRTWEGPPSGDGERSSRSRSYGSPPAALHPSPQPPIPGNLPRSPRSRTWEGPPSATFTPPPSGNRDRSLRSRSYSEPNGPPPSGNVNRRIFQPQTVHPQASSQPRVTQPPPQQFQPRNSPPRQAESQSSQARPSQRGSRRQEGNNEGVVRR